MFKIFCKIDDIDIPLVSTGTSPFIGAGQFGSKAFEWRTRFLNNPMAMFEILEASYGEGARGIEVMPITFIPFFFAPTAISRVTAFNPEWEKIIIASCSSN